MKGFVPTPPSLVDTMVDRLFANRAPRREESVLDPGCGTGAFIEGILRWCARNSGPVPRIVGVDSDPVLLSVAKSRIGAVPEVTLVLSDFLCGEPERFDYVIGNPPYVSITGLSENERRGYREAFGSAVGRFDLYILFFEQAIRALKPTGRLVFVTPEKFLYVQSAKWIRRKLAETGVEAVELIDESAFPGLVTYPAITTLDRRNAGTPTGMFDRQGTRRNIDLPGDGASWLRGLSNQSVTGSRHVLTEAFTRISCGVATGADGVFVFRDRDLPEHLTLYSRPTVSGRELVMDDELRPSSHMLMPYADDGTLIPELELGVLGDYLRQPDRYARLMKRTCTARKPWYAFHETPPLQEILRPKILCKDIGSRPWFVADERGSVVPRHSVYYLVPAEPFRMAEVCSYLNSAPVAEFLLANCQRAANGFIRLQSHILKQVPLPEEFAAQSQLAYA